MIDSIKVEDFKAVPYLETSDLMKTHKKIVRFSNEKPNVIVGPNGAGKSALLKTLSIVTLSYLTGESTFDDDYVLGNDSKNFWGGERGWRRDYQFLPGLTVDGDKAPALYYRPSHIPGNDDSVVCAMMNGYSKQAHAYLDKVDKKSAGQQSQRLLEKLLKALAGDVSAMTYQYANWRSGKTPRDLDAVKHHVSDFEYQFEFLRKMYSTFPEDAMRVILMDEPEQSLDAKAEALLWGQIAKADCSKVQVIVATHSLYPLMHPELFNLIEAVPGYIKEVRALM